MPTKIQKIRCKSKKKSVKYNRPQGLQSEAAQEGQRTKVNGCNRAALCLQRIVNYLSSLLAYRAQRRKNYQLSIIN